MNGTDVARALPARPHVVDWRTVTTKIEVATYDLYLHVSFDTCGNPVHVDLVVSPHPAVFHPPAGESLREAEILSEQIHFLKGSLEVICRHASSLLARGAWTLGDLCEAWRGTAVYHGGAACIAGDMQFVSGPLDAAARVIEARMERWAWTKRA